MIVLPHATYDSIDKVFQDWIAAHSTEPTIAAFIKWLRDEFKKHFKRGT